jgi:Fe-S cluster biogenesis protein NfuA
MPQDRGFQDRVRKIEALIQAIEETADPAVRDDARMLMQTILELHGVGLLKIMEFAHHAGHHELVDALARDDLVGSLLLLHGIHPLDQRTRIEQALEKLRPRLFLHGGGAELLGVEQNIVRVHLKARSDGNPANADPVQLKEWIEAAICAAAPEVAAIEFEGAEPSGLLSLPIVAGELVRGQP